MDTASATQTYSNQFRMAIYDFGGSASTLGLRSLFSLSASLFQRQDGGWQDRPDVGERPEREQRSGRPVHRNSRDRRRYRHHRIGHVVQSARILFFVSDGVADESNTACLKPRSGTTRCQSPLNPALCKTMKDRGVKIAVLYTTYLALPTNTWYMNWINPFNAGPYGPSPNSEIAKNMQSCASTGLYFEVGPTEGISDAMNALFKKAVADAGAWLTALPPFRAMPRHRAESRAA